MQFTTQIPIEKSNHPIDYSSRVVSLGSCFAVNIGQKFDYYKFRNITNPFGILFHPLALEKFIGFAVNHKKFTEADIFFHNERWHSFDAHSDISNPDKDILLDNLTGASENMATELKAATHLIITLGTAWAYRSIEGGNLVANCHKVPQNKFTKELLPVPAIMQSLENIILMAAKVNPDLKVIFTVSPVRHIKDGFTQNQWSKANLISAVNQLIHINHMALDCVYFPSYEIMMDELRDYRFYAQDMIHPNQTAIDYIWQRFAETYTTPAARVTMKEVQNIQNGLQHRPFNPYSAQHQVFLSSLQQKITVLQQQYPHISF